MYLYKEDVVVNADKEQVDALLASGWSLDEPKVKKLAAKTSKVEPVVETPADEIQTEPVTVGSDDVASEEAGVKGPQKRVLRGRK